jgi:hypothetical protein
MAVPVPVCTVTPSTVIATDSTPNPEVTLADTNTPTPQATLRRWRTGTTELTTASGAPAPSSKVWAVEGLADGAHANINVQTTNTDGTGTSANVSLTVTDRVATPTVARKVQTDVPGQTRVHPEYLPWEYRDPTIATPGLPTAQRLARARRLGSIVS